MSFENAPLVDWIPGIGEVSHYEEGYSVGPQHLTLTPLRVEEDHQDAKKTPRYGDPANFDCPAASELGIS